MGVHGTAAAQLNLINPAHPPPTHHRRSFMVVVEERKHLPALKQFLKLYSVRAWRWCWCCRRCRCCFCCCCTSRLPSSMSLAPALLCPPPHLHITG